MQELGRAATVTVPKYPAVHLQSVTAVAPANVVDALDGHADGVVTVCEAPATVPVHTPPGYEGNRVVHAV